MSTWKRGGGNWRSRAPDTNSPEEGTPNGVAKPTDAISSPSFARNDMYQQQYQQQQQYAPGPFQGQQPQQPFYQQVPMQGRGQFVSNRGVGSPQMGFANRGGRGGATNIARGRSFSASAFEDNSFGERLEEREERQEALREALGGEEEFPIGRRSSSSSSFGTYDQQQQGYDVGGFSDPNMIYNQPQFFRGGQAQRGGFARGGNFGRGNQIRPAVSYDVTADYQGAFNGSPSTGRHYNPRYEGTRGQQFGQIQRYASWGAEQPGDRYDPNWGANGGQFPQYQAQYQNVPFNAAAPYQQQFAAAPYPGYAPQGYTSPYTQPFQQRPPFERKIEGDHTETVEIAHDKLGLVIGKQGKTIQHIERVCRVFIVKPKRDEPPLFDIKGTKENVLKARVMILSAAYPMSEGNMIKSKTNVIANNNEMAFAQLKITPETLAAYDFSYREIYVLDTPPVEADDLARAAALGNQYKAQFQMDIDEVLRRDPPEGVNKVKLSAYLSKMLFANPPEELLARSFTTEEYIHLIEGKAIRYSLQNLSVPSEAELIVQKLKAEGFEPKTLEFFDVTGVDEEQKTHFKWLIKPDLTYRKLYSKEGRLVQSDILLPGQKHDVRYAFQRGKIAEVDEPTKTFISEIKIQDTELIPSASIRFHVEFVRHKIRSRFETTKGYIFDITQVTSNETGIVRKRTEVEVTTRAIKNLCKKSFDNKQLTELVPDLWDAVMFVNNVGATQ